MIIEYTDERHHYAYFRRRVLGLAGEYGPRVCDIGGGAKPVVPPDSVGGLDYTVVDLSAEELAEAAPVYRKVQADACGDVSGLGPFDVVVSRMVAEHIADPERFHRNCRSMLREGGVAAHIFPTLWSPSFAANRLLPDAIAGRVKDATRGVGDAKRFPAYYRWCRGPSERQVERFRSVGFDVVEYVGFFGTNYLKRVGPAQRMVDRVSGWLAEHPRPTLTAYSMVVLRR